MQAVDVYFLIGSIGIYCSIVLRIVGCVWPWTVMYMWSIPNINLFCVVLLKHYEFLEVTHPCIYIWIQSHSSWAYSLKLWNYIDALVSIGTMRAAKIMHDEWCNGRSSRITQKWPYLCNVGCCYTCFTSNCWSWSVGGWLAASSAGTIYNRWVHEAFMYIMYSIRVRGCPELHGPSPTFHFKPQPYGVLIVFFGSTGALSRQRGDFAALHVCCFQIDRSMGLLSVLVIRTQRKAMKLPFNIYMLGLNVAELIAVSSRPSMCRLEWSVRVESYSCANHLLIERV